MGADPLLALKPQTMAVDWNQQLRGTWWIGDAAPGLVMLCLKYAHQQLMLTECQVLYGLVTHRLDGRPLPARTVRLLWSAFDWMRMSVRSETYVPQSYKSFVMGFCKSMYPPLGWMLGKPIPTTQQWLRDNGAFPPPHQFYVFGGATFFKGGLNWTDSTGDARSRIGLLREFGWLDFYSEWFTGSERSCSDSGLRDITKLVAWTLPYIEGQRGD